MKLAGAKVLVTGAAGFLGSHVVDALVSEEAEVTALDDLSTGVLANLDAARARIRFVRVDVRDRAGVVEAMRGQQLVFHFAANADVPRSAREPDYDFAVNVVGGQNVLRAAVDQGARVVFASSAAVYGPPAKAPVDEQHPLMPISPYGAAKVAVEKLGFAYAEVYGLPFTAVRIFNTYGERQPRYVMFDLLRKIAVDPARLEVLGTGDQRRSYCHVSDAARLFLLAGASDEAVGQAVNLAGESTVSIRELASLIARLLGRSEMSFTFTGQSWPGDISLLSGASTWARTHLGWTPTVPLDEGILRLVDWLERQFGWNLRA